MPTITPEHILADQAVNTVAAVLNRVGALAERIKNDYGEDLLVQSHLDGIADDFRLLIQVKGINSRIRKGAIRVIRLKVPHLRRWISQLDPVLVCIFDSSSGLVYAFAPIEKFSLWELATTRRQTISIKLSKGDIFDESTGRKFIWKCRIEHWSRLLAWHENRFSYHHELHGPAKKHAATSKRIEREGNLITFYFLRAIGIIRDNQISQNFRHKVENCSKNFSKLNQKRGEKLSMPAALTLAVLAQVHEVCKIPLPANLLKHGYFVCEAFFRQWHPEEWKLASARLPKSD